MLMTVAAGLMLVAEAKVRVREVRLADLVAGADPAAGPRIVLRLPAGQRQTVLPAPVAIALVHRATGLRAIAAGPVRILLSPPPLIRRAWQRAPTIAAGTPLTLRSVAGPVVIERPVTTLQPGRAGRSVFVRDGQGQVFAAPLAMEGGA